ncbi:hypothetical protein [Haladaptatus sp. DFWS20]|uniref:hypothetical protein n=1 Tax=Haladaptatus sp. DFWS20 TaxID=3403467 RepID=UPI003EB9946F
MTIGDGLLEDGVTVNAAARSVTEHDGRGAIDLDTTENGEMYGRSIVADITDEHFRKMVTKTERKTDVTTAEISLIDVSIQVD